MRRRTYNKRVIGSESGKYIVLVATNLRGVYISRDYGQTWEFIAIDITTGFSSAAVSSSGQFMVIAAYGESIYISDSYGASWRATASPSLQWDDVAISDNGMYITATQTSGNIFVSNNSGNSFIEKMVESGSISMSSDGKKQIVGSSSTYFSWSDNYGETWQQKTLGQSGVVKVALSPNGKNIMVSYYGGNLYIGNDFVDGLNAVDALGKRYWYKLAITNNSIMSATAKSGEPVFSTNDAWNTFKIPFTARLNYPVIDISSDGNVQMVADRKADPMISYDFWESHIKLTTLGRSNWAAIAINK